LFVKRPLRRLDLLAWLRVLLSRARRAFRSAVRTRAALSPRPLAFGALRPQGLRACSLPTASANGHTLAGALERFPARTCGLLAALAG
jgi:hypothetical protein